MRLSSIAAMAGLLLAPAFVIGQYKNDNVAFKTVYMEEFCKQFKSNPKAVLLDVRSQGEYDDTSKSVGLNIGRLKATAHIDIQDLPKRLQDLSQYKDQPVYVYCSHSQRSRRASKMLADSGFTNVINVNGGLTTFNLLDMQKECADFYETSLEYKLVSPLDVCHFLEQNKNAFILDIRKDSAFKGISTEERQNAFGKFNGSINIPFDWVTASYHLIPKDRPILLVNDFSTTAATVAGMLVDHGYKNVHVLFNGLDALASADKKDIACINKYWTQNIPYKLVTPIEFDQLATKEKNLQIVDVRPADEFNSQSKTTWRNVGILKNAINIPISDFQSNWNQLDKNKPVLVYHFGGPESYTAAKILTNNGFQNVYVLTPGLFSVRWQAANLKGKEKLKDWVINVPEENR